MTESNWAYFEAKGVACNFVSELLSEMEFSARIILLMENMVCMASMHGSRVEGRKSRTPLKSQNRGFLSNTDPLKITKLPSQHSMLGHHRHASKMPFKWRFAGGPRMARL